MTLGVIESPKDFVVVCFVFNQYKSKQFCRLKRPRKREKKLKRFVKGDVEF